MSSLYGIYVLQLFFFFARMLSEAKDIQLQAWTISNGCRKLRIPERLDIRHMKVVKVASLTHQPPLHYSRYPWYSFLLETELPHGNSADGIIKSIKNPDLIGNRTRGLPACTEVPQPTAPPNTCPLRQLSQKFYPDLELLSNGAGIYTRQVFYDVTETEEERRARKVRRCVIIRLYNICVKWVKRNRHQLWNDTEW